MLNIAEGFERGSNTEFANFLNIAKGSAGETRSILYILFDIEMIDKSSFNDLHSAVLKISMHLSGFRKFLLQNKSRKK